MKSVRYAALLAMGLLLAACGPQAEGEGSEAAGQASISSNQTGTDGGYYYSFWTNGQGYANMTLDGSNGYSVSWSNVGDFTAGKGWRNGSGHTISFSGSYNHSGGGGFGIYGWTRNPLIEYYIVEKAGNGGSPGQGTQVGTMTSDGSTYTVWKHQQVNQPCITGNTCTFWQYISVRQSQRTSGTITIQNHFNYWSQHQMSLGSHDYQILLTEGWNGSGNSSGKVSEGGGTSSGGTSSGGTSSGGTSSGGTSSGGTGRCTATLSAGSKWSDRYNLNVSVAGSNTWTVTMNVPSPAKIIATWNINASWPTAQQMIAKPNGSGNNFGVTIQHNGNWTWPTVSCVPY